MEHTPPPLATLLDLPTPMLVEVTPRHAQLSALLMLAEKDRPEEVRTAAQALEIMGADLPRLPDNVRLTLQCVARMAPQCRVSAALLGVVSSMATRPAESVMWAHAVAAHYARTGVPSTLHSVFVQHYGGWLPSPEGLHHTWLAQKVSPQVRADPDWEYSDNWLDHPAAWTQEALKSGAVERVPVADESR